MSTKVLPAKGKRYPTFLCTDAKIRVAILDSKGLHVLTLGDYPLTAGIIINGEVRDVDKLAAVLIQISATLKLKERFVIVGISEIKATTRGLTLPALSDDEIGQAVIHEVSSVLPFAYTDEYLDWKVILATNEEKRVLVSAIPRSIVDGFVMAFQKANLAPVAFETTALSLYRLVPPEGKKLCFMAELDQEWNVLTLMIDGAIEACSVVQDQTSLTGHLEKMIEYYVTSGKKQSPQTIYLSGSRATEAVAQEIKTKLKLNPAFLHAPVAGVPAGREVELALLLSLARKTVKPPADPTSINVLPEILDSSYQTIAWRAREHDIKVLLLVVVVVATMALAAAWFKVHQATVAFSPGGVRTATGSAVILAYQPAKFALVKKTSQDSTSLTNMVDVILEKAPDGIVLSGINFDKGKKEISVIGIAVERANLLTFKQVLTDTKLFTDVFIPLSSLEQNAQVDFRIRLTVNIPK